MHRKELLIIVFIAVVIVGFIALYANQISTRNALINGIASFEECSNAGFPILDSYPEQCETPDGRKFVRILPDEERKEASSPITVSGHLVCLPHWDTSGPQTLECAFGLQDGMGNYYSLQSADSSQSDLGSISTDSLIEIQGLYIPGSHEKYQTIGTVIIEEIRELESN